MERPAPAAVVTADRHTEPETLLAQLRALQTRVVAIAYPNHTDLVGRELDLIDHALRRLLRELGDRDSVDA